jgi:DNA-binding PadR family transcriptional regulator
MRALYSPTQIIQTIILSRIVVDGPLHGYALASAIEEKFGWKPSQTTIYNTLRSLESQKAVTVEERVESGRAQKIYSITEEGHSFFSRTKKNLVSSMGKRFSQLLTLMQDFTNTDYFEESDGPHKCQDLFEEDMELFPLLIFKLLHLAPEETRKILTQTFASLKQLANKFDVTLKQQEKNCPSEE